MFNTPYKKSTVWLSFIFLILLSLNIIGIIFEYASDTDHTKFFFRVTNFDSETSIATFYSSLILLFSSFLLFIIYVQKRRLGNKAISWLLLSLIFLFLSVDESVSIHERFISFYRNKFNLSGFLYFSWVIPYGILAILLFFYFIPFLINLEKRTTMLFVLSGFVFVSGAIGMELLGGKYFETNGKVWQYTIFYTIEESLEILGISIFIYSLLRYISIKFKNIQFSVQLFLVSILYIIITFIVFIIVNYKHSFFGYDYQSTDCQLLVLVDQIFNFQ